MPEYDMPIEEQVKRLAKQLDGFEKRLDEKFDQIDKKFDKVDARFDQIDKKFEKVDERFDQVMVRLEETRDIAKLGLEGLEGLQTNADQTGLLKAVLVHVRNRVEVIERPKPRRR
jgi:predicted nuclease with TOPRIM domain